MNISYLINNLNIQQKEIVTSPNGNLLVLAGAGSGKTRVIVHRIAWLLSIKKYPPNSIMAMTFTNKTAIEMRHRIEVLIGDKCIGMWIGTFHSIAHRILRIHHTDANLPSTFQILDNYDQLRILKRLISEMNLNEKQWTPHQAMWYINSKKEIGVRPQYIENDVNVNTTEMIWQRIYQAYQIICSRSGLVDFTELLLRTYELLLFNSHILIKYREQFINILIDEFQDTNYIQYALIKQLTNNISHVMIVGDEDQSIYGWRGAKIENIQNFLNDFNNVTITRLEQNYRSTNKILQATNSLIAHNTNRFRKRLWTSGSEGEPIILGCAFNDLEEAYFVVHCINNRYKNGGKLKDCAILYRKNIQSRIIEETLLNMKLPYRIYGGIRFFERQEVKDAISYLRLINNRDDDVAYERIINRPMRNLGKKTLHIIHETAQQNQLTLWQASLLLLNKKLLTNKAHCALQSFVKLINDLAIQTLQLPLYLQTDIIIKNSGLWNMYANDNSEKSKIQIENLEELITAARQFKSNGIIQNQNIQSPLQEFLSQSSLEDTNTFNNLDQDAVQLMTIHASKGLEFTQVFIIGMEEGIFPTHMSMNKKWQLEEERRLAYVGMTRAMKKLIITYAIKRHIHGKEVYYKLSRFVKELPLTCIKKICIPIHYPNILGNINSKIIHKNNNKFFNKVIY